MILEINAQLAVKIIAKSMDDSFGESFDKVAKMLNIGYPGGPIVEKYAHLGDANAIDFPLPLKHKKELAFSFSGLKNAVRLEVEKHTILDDKKCADICASFQKTAIEHIAKMCEKYLKYSTIQNFAVVGGASANQNLREHLEGICRKYKKNILFSKMSFCSDNAAMIGRAAIPKFLSGDFTHYADLKPNPVTTIF